MSRTAARSRRSRATPGPSAVRPPRLRRQVLGLALLVLVACGTYLETLRHDFVWDDRKLIVEDPAIKSSHRLGEIFVHDFFYRHEDDVAYGYYRPLVTLSYMLDYDLHRLEPYGYHLSNLLLHAVATVLVFFCLAELGLSALAAWMAALLFAVHPVHTENVAWIAGRTDVVAFIFSALALLLFLRAGPLPPSAAGTAGRRRLLLLAGSLVAFTLGLLAKEMSVVVVPWVALVALLHQRRGWSGSARAALPYLGAFALYLVWRFAVIAVAPPGDPTEQGLAVVLLSLPHTLVRYLGKLLLPLELNAYLVNPYVTSLLDWRLWSSLALLALLAYGVLRLAPREPRLPLLAALLAVSFGPVLNLMRIAGPPDMGNVMAERFCYFPSFPFVGLAGLGLGVLIGSGRRSRRGAAVAALALLVAAGFAASWRRNRDWADELTFLNRTLAQSPIAVLLWGNLAVAYTEAKDYAAAARALERGEAIDPTNYHVLASKVFWYVAQDRAAEAVPLQEAIVHLVSRGEPKARNNLAYLYRVTGREEAARQLLVELLQEGRDYSDVHVNLGEIYRQRGQLDSARRHFELAFEESPHDERIALVLAGLELEAGDVDGAERIYRQQLELRPRDPDLLNNLATVRLRQGDLEGARELYAHLLMRHPDYARGHLNQAHVLFELGRRQEAWSEATTAARLAAGTELEPLVRDLLARIGGPDGGGGSGQTGLRR